MLTHPETEYLIARGARDEQIERALKRRDLREAGLSTGLRGAIAAALREAADHIDDSSLDDPVPPRAREQLAL